MDRGLKCSTGGRDQNHPKGKKMQEDKMSQEALQIAEERR